MNYFKQIFISLAKRFGLELQEKREIRYDYSVADDISLTAAMANRVATQVMYGSKAIITGDNARAEQIREISDKFNKTQMSTAVEVSFGTGGALVKPYTDGERIGIDIIKNENFVICESIGDFIKSCVIKADEIRQNTTTFERYEVQMLKTGTTETGQAVPVVVIYQLAYKDGKEVPLASVQSWADIQPETIIPNVDRLLFGYYKCPTVNRENVNSPDGVPITYGNEKVMRKAVEAYYRMNEEFEKKEAFVFADKTLFQIDQKTKKPILPRGKEALFMNVNSADSGKLIQEYSPEIRDASMQNAVDFNFRVLELLCGFSSGVLTPPMSNNATATEILALKEQTFAFVDKARDAVEQGTYDMLYAVDILCNVNGMTPPGEWNVTFDWSKELRENLEQKFNRLMQLQSIGAYGKEELRAFETKEDLTTAKERVDEIAETFVNEVI